MAHTVIDSEQKRMMVTQNYSQEQNTPQNIRPITREHAKRPSTVAIGVRIKNQSIDSTIRTNSKGDSLNFNKDEIESLKDVFNLFDKKNTGFVYEHDLMRILDIMNKDALEGNLF
jgi:hypothetical protein